MSFVEYSSSAVSFRVQRPTEPLRVAALHEGLAEAVFAQETVESIALAARPHTTLESNIWSFDMLARLDIRHASVRVGSAADVIVVAGAPSTSLPAHVVSWLTVCLRESRKDAPVMAVLYEEADHRHAYDIPTLRRDLISIAARWRTPLLCNGELHRYLDRGLIPQSGSSLESQIRPHFDLNALFATPHRSRGGINE